VETHALQVRQVALEDAPLETLRGNLHGKAQVEGGSTGRAMAD